MTASVMPQCGVMGKKPSRIVVNGGSAPLQLAMNGQQEVQVLDSSHRVQPTTMTDPTVKDGTLRECFGTCVSRLRDFEILGPCLVRPSRFC